MLSGLKTQALSTSGQGTGGYNQLVFDATPQQLRTQLSTTEYATSLALGHLKHQTDNQRGADRDHGAELTHPRLRQCPRRTGRVDHHSRRRRMGVRRDKR
ncbi:type VI secretion system Vgr family protein [Salinisphaera sp.]|uniref:type VI secretion system Vgr family protein n=1 Tax=Salinisphaera sp. TaxID=1914330 RepID=UPI0025E76643|nr:type VI secretion system Vgr family protein [Salinisphaera sp.]